MSLTRPSHDLTSHRAHQRWIPILVLLSLVTVLLVSSGYGPSAGATPRLTPTLVEFHPAGGATVTTAGSAQFPTPIRHVFTIVLENAGLSTVLSQGSYLKTLYDTYAGASQYYGVCHPSAPNYLAMTSGKPLQCGTDNVNSYPATNIADLVTAQGETWAGYFQSMPSPCYPLWSDNLYKPGHNPFIYYSDLTSSGACSAHDLPLSSFNPSAAPPNYVFIAPNLLNDGHNTSVGYANNWLKGYLPTLLAEPWASSTVFFVVYDEGSPSDSSGYDGLDGGHTYLTAVSPYSLGVGLYTADSSPYSLLSTIEWLLGTGNTGANDAKSQFGPMKSMFSVGTGPSKFTLMGQVDASATGQPISDATVSIPAITPVTTNSTGGYSFSLSNGTYPVTASATGFNSTTASVKIAGQSVQQNFALNATAQPRYALSGTVTDAANGSGIAGAIVSIPGIPSTITDATGGYKFTLSNGTYALTASAAGFNSTTASVSIFGKSVHHDFVLGPSAEPQYTLSGTVIYAANGSAIPGAAVAVSDGPVTTTNLTGNFALNLVNGTYTVRASTAGFRSSETGISIAGAPITLNFSLSSLSPSVYALSGEVVYAANLTAVAGAVVTLNGGVPVDTGANGSYSFLVANGTYDLAILQSGFYAQDAIVTVAGASPVDDFDLYPFLFQIEGVVLSKINGDPLVGANVSLSPTVWQFAGPNGAYDFWVPNGTYLLQVGVEGYASATVPLSLHGQPVITNLSLSTGLAPITPSESHGTSDGQWLVVGVVAATAIVSALIGFVCGSKGRAGSRKR